MTRPHVLPLSVLRRITLSIRPGTSALLKRPSEETMTVPWLLTTIAGMRYSQSLAVPVKVLLNGTLVDATSARATAAARNQPDTARRTDVGRAARARRGHRSGEGPWVNVFNTGDWAGIWQEGMWAGKGSACGEQAAVRITAR